MTEQNDGSLDDFGDATIHDEDYEHELKIKSPKSNSLVPKCKDTCEEASQEFTYTQWSIGGNGRFFGTGITLPTLPPGMYKAFISDSHGPFAERMDVKIDSLIDIPDGVSKQIFDEIQLFWKKEEVFKQYGFLHRRGYLLYGAAGCGKTALVQLICSRVVKEGDTVLICENPNALQAVLKMFRTIEPNRRIVCVFEDLDALVSNWGDSKILSLLDGEDQINRVLNIATSNYPERLDRRIVARPRRFDRVMKIGMPSAQTRHLYLKTKLNIKEKELDEWVEKTEGLSFAAMAELVISVKCLDHSFESSLKVLRDMAKGKSSSEDYLRDPAGFEKVYEGLNGR